MKIEDMTFAEGSPHSFSGRIFQTTGQVGRLTADLSELISPVMFESAVSVKNTSSTSTFGFVD
jgi:hypothetical protein